MADSLKGRDQKQRGQGNLEIYIDQTQTPGGVKVVVCKGVDPEILTELNHQAGVAQQDHVRECQGHACKVGRHVQYC